METNKEMTQENENNTNSPETGGQCCSSGSGSWKSLKTALFILVILAACTVAAHSVLSNGSSSPCGGVSGLCPLSQSCGTSSTCGLKASGAENATCIIKEKANTLPSCCPKAETPSCCPGTGTPACCPNAGTPDCCANTETPSGCPSMENPGGCPSTVSE